MNTIKPTVTIKDISAITGFSISTVSKALNDKKEISFETRQHILQIAKKHNYKPNPFAVALRKRK